jgi:hypothetical protein
LQVLDFTNALGEIAKELQLNKLLAIIEPWIKPGAQTALSPENKKDFMQLILKSNAAYEFLRRREATRAILEKSRSESFSMDLERRI